MQKSIKTIITLTAMSLAGLSYANQTAHADVTDMFQGTDDQLTTTPEGLSTTAWQSIQSQIKNDQQARQYHAYEQADGSYQSTNANQGWQIEYGRDGTTRLIPKGRSQENSQGHSQENSQATTESLSLRLHNIAYSSTEAPLAQQPQRISTDKQRLNYHWNENITEYWINSEAQLEQWFEVKQRPDANAQNRPLTVSMTLNTSLPVSLHNNHLKIGNINYNKLKVWDANGTIIPATMAYQAQQLSLVIDDSQVHYPLTIDPSFTQTSYIKASNTGAGDNFGDSVAISGDTVVVGARQENSNTTGVNGNQNNNGAINSGAVYVFVRNGATWAQQAYLKASNAGEGDRFGRSVAISDDTVVIGAANEDSNATGVNGNQNNNAAFASGAAYVFVRNGTTWTQQAYLKASNAEANDFFGISVVISDNTVVVGALREGSNATGVNGNQSNNSADDSGAAYVFVRSGATWVQEAYLKASNTGAGDQFGSSIAISGDTVVVGAVFEGSDTMGVNGDEGNNDATNSGAAYVFVRNGTTWTQEAYLKASNTGAFEQFGFSVAISGDTVVVGANAESSNATGVNGNEANNSAINSGAAYVFVSDVAGTWTQEAYLKASNTEIFDQFGSSIAISDDTVVVGARGEDSNATGVNGAQMDNSAFNSGVAYVFVRNVDTWAQQDYLKASNTGAFDQFSSSIAISDDTVVVGAVFEDSNAAGVNGDEDNNDASDSGAVYAFKLPTHTIGGSVTGLATGNSVELQNNNGDNLTVNANGNFTFATALTDGSAYAVTVLTQPSTPNQTCTVTANGSGTLAGTNVTNVEVTCVTDTYTIGGTVTGLAMGNSVTLQNNGGDNLTVSADGGFTFATALADGLAYAVTVLTQPTTPNQVCTVANDSGNLAGNDVVDVAVTCATDTHTVAGTVTGLATGNSVVLQNNAGDDLTVSADGVFTFATALADGSAYAVTVLTQPTKPNQVCTVVNGSGIVAGNDVVNVAVTCSTDTHTIAGAVTGLAAGNNVVLQNNTGDDLTVSADGGFTFATALTDGSAYAVTVLTQPTTPNQVCTVVNGSGIVAGNDVVNVTVACSTDTHTIAGTVTGLATGNSVVLQNNAGDDLTINVDGGFTFTTALADGSAYTVTVLTQPTSPTQTCTVTNGAGTIAGSDITDVVITCVTDTYTVGGMISGLAATSTVTLQNNGTDDLVINADGAFTFATSLADGSTYDVTVLNQVFRANSLACSVTNNTGQINAANVNNITVSCAVQTAIIQLSDVSIDFNSVTINTAATQTITITNIGTADLNLSAISSPASPFSIVSGSCLSLPILLAPNANCDLEVMFLPDGIGTFSAVIDVTSDAGSSPDQVTINGTAVGVTEPQTIPVLNVWMLMLLGVLMFALAVKHRRSVN